jgi:hypothetical protein
MADIVKYYRIKEEPHWFDGMMTLRVQVFVAVKRTPRGAWIVPAGGWHTKQKFVLDGAGKRFAYPTIEAAKESFIARKTRQIALLEQNLIFANAALRHAAGPFTLDTPFHDEALDQFHCY